MRVPEVMDPDHGRRVFAEHPAAPLLCLAGQVGEPLRVPEAALVVAEHNGVIAGELEDQGAALAHWRCRTGLQSACNAGVQRCEAPCLEGEIAVTDRQRSPVLIVAVILLLAACGGTASSSSATHTPAPAPTATAAALVKGEFVGDAGQLAGIALSTNGQQVIAYLCNGSYQHVSLAEWFKGPVTSTGIDITNAHGAHLIAAVSAQAITGTVTLKDGTSEPFTARLLPDPGRIYGLFRSEETFNGVRYLGGWIFNPPHFASFRTGTGTPGVSLTSVMVPMPICCVPGEDVHRVEGVGIIDEQTGALIVSPVVENLVSVTVPGLGTFRLTPCREAQC